MPGILILEKPDNVSVVAFIDGQVLLLTTMGIGMTEREQTRMTGRMGVEAVGLQAGQPDFGRDA